MGQASTYTAEDGATICAALSEGHSLLSICEAMGISYDTAYGWERDIPQHGKDSARAREIGCHAMADKCLQIACTPMIGEERTIRPDGSIEVREGDMLAHRKLMIDTHMRLLGKWLPKVYGDKVAIGGATDLPPIKTDSTVTLTPEDAYKRMLNGK